LGQRLFKSYLVSCPRSKFKKMCVPEVSLKKCERVESLLLSQRLFWGCPLCGAKSKELGPAALRQLLIFIRHRSLADFTRHCSVRLFPQNTRISFAKTFQPPSLGFYSFFWDMILEVSVISETGGK
jgi:hypothetical protein